MCKLIGIASHYATRGDIMVHDKIKISVENGLENDFRGTLHPDKQVTLLSHQSWNDACQELGTQLSWIVRRANLLIDDIAFDEKWVGQQIQIGDVLLEVTEETDPCERMDEVHPGLKNALLPNWRGGVRCRVLREGVVQLHDRINVLVRV